MRIHFIIERASEDFWIDDMPQIPHVGDGIHFPDIYTGYSNEAMEIFNEHTFFVEDVIWSKDADGYFVIISCDIAQ